LKLHSISCCRFRLQRCLVRSLSGFPVLSAPAPDSQILSCCQRVTGLGHQRVRAWYARESPKQSRQYDVSPPFERRKHTTLSTQTISSAVLLQSLSPQYRALQYHSLRTIASALFDQGHSLSATPSKPSLQSRPLGTSAASLTQRHSLDINGQKSYDRSDQEPSMIACALTHALVKFRST
jgi:hypothetical protein